ncbi:MAG: rRNA pseudouridine synthase [Candidatus Riflebacteria bacterium]|nr:rRNA pseudouridine synthase [Candidatus Riflebacteria bacterium]
MTEENIRLSKLLSSWGFASRRKVEELISEGRIVVDGILVEEQGLKVDPANVKIEVDGNEISSDKAGLQIFAFHKPPNVLSSLKDDFGRKTLSDFIKHLPRVFPIGRLDYDTTGLILLTNQGELANKLLHPRYKVEKEYFATVSGKPLTKEEMIRFSQGIELEDGLTAPCTIKFVKENSYQVVLREGRKRQVKRMFQFFYLRVESLVRTSFGPIHLGNLPEGKLRSLTDKEIRNLTNSISV